MTIFTDPEGNEIQALQRLSAGFAEKTILEIGCGSGRLTRLIAPQAAQVVAIDPDAQKVAQAQAQSPEELLERIEHLAIGLEIYAKMYKPDHHFDRVILSWSL
jgi:2-polyprenyl-3-methyl-5-hydroxy-6-metoxy-1,4-benzoquinol methylase